MILRRTFLKVLILAAVIAPAAAGADLPVKFERRGNTVEVLIGGKPFTTYYFGREAPKPYLHPQRTAQGTIITRGFPMVKNIPGESRDHPHHRALYFAHGNINGIDFWSEAEPNKSQQTAKGVYYPSSEELPKGRTVFQEMREMKSGADSGTIQAVFELLGPDGKAIGSESQGYIFRGTGNTRTIDCTFTITADRRVPLKMGDTKEGTFAIRVVKALEEPSGKMLNSEGKVGEKEIWGKRANWVDYSGTVKNEKLGIAIFDDPQNIKHPTYWHARGYGLFAVNPFGEHDYYNDPKRDGSFTIPSGQSLTLRYRVFIHHGDAAEARVADAYQSYAEGK